MEVEALYNPALLAPLTDLLPPFPPTKLRARLPFPVPKNLAAADLTPLLTPKLDDVGVVAAEGLSFS